MKKLLALSAIAGMIVVSGCTSEFGGSSSSGIVGTYSDSCSAPQSSFIFRNGGSGTIQARGMTRNFTWTQNGRTAYVSVPTSGGTPAQTYVLSRTQSGVYLSGLTVNGKQQNLTAVPASERTKTKCS
ncbi:MAG: hypothetical protein ACK5MJ_06870 [Alphaproteobacteria bacterium]